MTVRMGYDFAKTVVVPEKSLDFLGRGGATAWANFSCFARKWAIQSLWRRERNNTAEKGVRNDIWAERQNGSWTVKVELFQIEKGFTMSASFGVFLFKSLYFLRVLNWKKSVKNALLTKTTKNQVVFRKECEIVKTGLKKSQKTTEIFFDEVSRWIMVITYNTDLKNR